MKAARQGNDFVGVLLAHLAHVTARQLDGRFVGFRAGIAEKYLAVMAFGQNAARQLQLRLLIKKIAHMPQTPGLLHESGRHFIIAVPETGNGNTGQQIHVFLAVHIPQAGAFPARNGNGIAAVGTTQQALFLLLHLIKGLAHGHTLLNCGHNVPGPISQNTLRALQAASCRRTRACQHYFSYLFK